MSIAPGGGRILGGKATAEVYRSLTWGTEREKFEPRKRAKHTGDREQVKPNGDEQIRGGGEDENALVKGGRERRDKGAVGGSFG